MGEGRHTLPDLRKFGCKNDDASSLIVRRIKNFNACKVFQRGDFKGWKAVFPIGEYTLGDAQKRGFKNDDCSSIVVVKGHEVEMFQHGNFKGWSAVIPAGRHKLADCRKFGMKNDDASSLKVRFAGSGDDAW